jgi:plastocyanin
VTIEPGEQVTWNGDFVSHPLRQTAGPSSSTALQGGFQASSGSTFSLTFATAGTFYYFCNFHGVAFNMRGTVAVKPFFADGFED